MKGGEDQQSAIHTGLGDIDVGARWFFLRMRDFGAQARQDFGLSAGVTLPTGPNAASEGGMRLDDHAQLGAGSFGPYFGLTVDGEDQVHTGRLVLSAAPGISVNLFDDVWLRGRIQIPLVKVLDGDQAVGVTLFASVQLLVP